MHNQVQHRDLNDHPDDQYTSLAFTLHRSPAILTLGLDDDADQMVPAVEKRFWKRQFGPVVTRAQRRFDWVFGVIMPVACIALDPFVFRSWNGDGLLIAIKSFVYLLSYVSIMAMIAWLLLGSKLKGFNGAIAGLFAIAGFTSLAIGVVLFPFSLIGLIVAIGALGFTPLFTSIVFFRNSARAYHSAKPFLEPDFLQNIFAISALFSAVVPYVFNLEMGKGLADQLEHLLR